MHFSSGVNGIVEDQLWQLVGAVSSSTHKNNANAQAPGFGQQQCVLLPTCHFKHPICVNTCRVVTTQNPG